MSDDPDRTTSDERFTAFLHSLDPEDVLPERITNASETELRMIRRARGGR